MRRIMMVLTMTALVAGISALASSQAMAGREARGGRGDGPVVYVTSQGLYYDSIVTADPLPPRGKFQQLRMGARGLETEFGPGDRGYRGGRWWIDRNNNGRMDEADKYFSCPLLGPGRNSP